MIRVAGSLDWLFINYSRNLLNGLSAENKNKRIQMLTVRGHRCKDSVFSLMTGSTKNRSICVLCELVLSDRIIHLYNNIEYLL